MKPDTWLVSYWSVKVQRSSIMKYGTEADKARLPEVTRRNRARNQTVQTSSNGRQVKQRRIRRPPRVTPQLCTEVPPPEEILPLLPLQEDALSRASSPPLLVARTPSPPPLVARTPSPLPPARRVQTPSPLPPARRVLRQRAPPKHRIMQSRYEQVDAFKSAFSHVNVEDVQRPISPPVSEITPRIVLPGQCGDCRQAVSNQHICDICRSRMHIFCGIPVGPPGHNQKRRCKYCQAAIA